MEQEENTSRLARIPFCVAAEIIKYLNIYQLKRLRLVSPITRSWVDEYHNLFSKYPVTIDSQEKLSKINSDPHKSYQNFKLSYPVLQHKNSSNLSSFGTNYSEKIKHIQLQGNPERSIPFHHFLNSNFKNLQTLEFTHFWAIQTFFQTHNTPNPLAEVFKNLKNLKLQINIHQNNLLPANWNTRFGDFLLQFSTLNTLHLEYNSCFENPLYSVATRQIIPYLRTRSPKFRNLIDQQHENISDFLQNQESTLVFPLMTKICKSFSKIGFNFKEIENEKFICNSIDQGFISLLTLCGGGDDFFQYDLEFPQNQTKHISEYNIYEDPSEFPSPEVYPGNDDPTAAFYNMTKLTFYNHSSSISPMLNSQNRILAIKNDNVKEFILPLLSADTYYEIGELYLNSFRNLERLTIYGLFSPDWAIYPGLRNLKRLNLHSVPLDNEVLMGYHPEDEEDPLFLKFTNLTHLTINSGDRPFRSFFTDKVFERVFSQMKLKSFIMSELNYEFTENGLLALATGPFGQTIEEFPYPWKRQEPYSQLMSLRHPEISDTVYFTPFFTVEQFDEFKQQHFKYFAR